MKFKLVLFLNIFVINIISSDLQFMEAITNNNVNALQNLIYNSPEDLEEVVNKKVGSYSLLERAVMEGSKDVVEFLILNGVDVNFDNGSALLFANALNQLEIAELLLKQGNANPNLVNKSGKFPLGSAIFNPAMVKLLIEYGADVSEKLDGKPLFDCAESYPATAAEIKNLLTNAKQIRKAKLERDKKSA